MINLLPEKNKKRVRNEILRRLLVVLGFGISIILIVQIVFFLVVYFLLDSYLGDYAEQIAASEDSAREENLHDMESEITRLNEMVLSFKDNQDIVRPFSVYLSALFESVGEGIAVDGLIFETTQFGQDRGRLKLFLSGHAGTRGKLISFVEQLESNEEFVSVDLPVSNLLAEKDINFSLTVNIRNN